MYVIVQVREFAEPLQLGVLADPLTVALIDPPVRGAAFLVTTKVIIQSSPDESTFGEPIAGPLTPHECKESFSLASYPSGTLL